MQLGDSNISGEIQKHQYNLVCDPKHAKVNTMYYRSIRQDV